MSDESDFSLEAQKRRAATRVIDPRDEMMNSLGKLSPSVRDAVDTAIIEYSFPGQYHNSDGSVDDRGGAKYLVQAESSAMADINRKLTLAAEEMAKSDPNSRAHRNAKLVFEQCQATGKVQMQLEEAQAVQAAADYDARAARDALELEIIEEASALQVINELRAKHGLPPKQA